MYSIRFQSADSSFREVLVKEVPAGYSLLEVALDSDIALNHRCGMVCCCHSCHIYVTSGQEFLEDAGTREQEFLSEAEDLRANSRLGCQAVLTEGEGCLEVIIPIQN